MVLLTHDGLACAKTWVSETSDQKAYGLGRMSDWPF
jgi:hypothetical protein